MIRKPGEALIRRSTTSNLRPRCIRVIVAALTVASCISTACAQAPSASTDPTNFDVGGVKLGMTPDEAMAAIKAFDPALSVARKYLSGANLSWGMEGSDLDRLSDADKDTSFLEELVAIKTKPKQFCHPDPMMPCSESYEDDQDVVKVWFSRAPDRQQAIMILRQKTFYKDPKPSIDSLKSSILAKYPEPQPTIEFKRGPYILTWLFDARRQLLAGGTAKRKGIPVTQTVDGIPPSVRPGDGIALNAVFLPDGFGSQLAGQFTLTLYDAGALFRSVKESATTYQTLKARVDAKQLDQSKGAAPTKF